MPDSPAAESRRRPARSAARLLFLPVAAVLIAVSLANCGQAFFFPLELELKEGTSWLHVLTMQAGISLYDHQHVAYVNMNHGPVGPLLKLIVASALPGLTPAMVTRTFVLLLPLGLYAALAAANPGRWRSALLWAAGLHVFLLGLQPPHFLVGRSDPNALFLLALMLAVIARPALQAGAKPGWRFGWAVAAGVLASLCFLTNWRFGPALGAALGALAVERAVRDGRAAVTSFLAGFTLGGAGCFLAVIYGVLHGDWDLYFRHFFGFFSAASGWGAGRGEHFELLPGPLVGAHWLLHLLALVGLAAGLARPAPEVPRRVQLLGWLPMLGLLWLTSCAAYLLNRSGGGVWYFASFYLLLAFHLARAVDWASLDFLRVRVPFYAALLAGLPWAATVQQASRLTDSFAPAYAFLGASREIAGGAPIHSEDYYFFKHRYEGEAIDVGDEVSTVAASGYFGPAYTATANAYFARLRSDPPRCVITGGSISPALKQLLAESYQPVLRVPADPTRYAGPPQTFYVRRAPPPGR